MGLAKNASTGCRPDQLFGWWAIEPEHFDRLRELVLAADLDALRAEARAIAEDGAGQPMYQMTADGIAIIEISGPMTKYETSFQALTGGTATLRTREALRTAARDPEVSGIMLRVDSPGGTHSGTAELAGAIRAAAARKPTHAFGDDLVGSAALWAATAATRFSANNGSEIGSIGAYALLKDTSGQLAKDGIKVYRVTSAALKGAGAAGTEITPEQLLEYERRVKDLADVFVADVASGRGMTKQQAQTLATGQMWVASQAKDLGLIDAVASWDEAMAELRSAIMEQEDLSTAKAEVVQAREQLEQERAARAEDSKKVLELTAEVTRMRTEQRQARFAKEAADLGLPTEMAAHLDKIEAADPVAFAAVVEQFRAKGAQVSTGELFKEKGSAGGARPGDGSAQAELEAKARELVTQGKAKDFYAGYALACAQDPALMKRVRAEERGKEA